MALVAGLVVALLLIRGSVWPWWHELVDDQTYQVERLQARVMLFEKLIAKRERGELTDDSGEREWAAFQDGFYPLEAVELASAQLQREVQAAAEQQGLTLTLINIPEVLEFDRYRMFSVRFSFSAPLPQLLKLLQALYNAPHHLVVPALETNFGKGAGKAQVELTVTGFQYLDA